MVLVHLDYSLWIQVSCRLLQEICVAALQQYVIVIPFTMAVYGHKDYCRTSLCVLCFECCCNCQPSSEAHNPQWKHSRCTPLCLFLCVWNTFVQRGNNDSLAFCVNGAVWKNWENKWIDICYHCIPKPCAESIGSMLANVPGEKYHETAQSLILKGWVIDWFLLQRL